MYLWCCTSIAFAQVCVAALRPVAVSGHQLGAAAGFKTAPSTDAFYTRVQSTVVQAFTEESGSGQAYVYAQYSDGTSRDVTAHANLSSAAPDTFAVVSPSAGTFNIEVCQRPPSYVMVCYWSSVWQQPLILHHGSDGEKV